MSRRRIPPGPDPDFPHLETHERVSFPLAETVPGDEPALYGANLSPGVLLSAYEQGFFPWYSEGEPLWWWSPDPRFGLAPSEAHCSATMAKVLRKGLFTLRLDTAFRQVMESCAASPRPGQDGTWITTDMINAYCRLHERGLAHSVEAWQDGRLVGGLYGVQCGRVFAGESMFTLVSNASKAAFLTLCKVLRDKGFVHLDSQVHTDHVESLGGHHIKRDTYLGILRKGLEDPLPPERW